jgi:hypothetical protein
VGGFEKGRGQNKSPLQSPLVSLSEFFFRLSKQDSGQRPERFSDLCFALPTKNCCMSWVRGCAA